jgi:hypothetical protein
MYIVDLIFLHIIFDTLNRAYFGIINDFKENRFSYFSYVFHIHEIAMLYVGVAEKSDTGGKVFEESTLTTNKALISFIVIIILPL